MDFLFFRYYCLAINDVTAHIPVKFIILHKFARKCWWLLNGRQIGGIYLIGEEQDSQETQATQCRAIKHQFTPRHD